jgi:hypothetical protein
MNLVNFSKQECPRTADLLAQTLSGLRNALNDFERYRAERPKRRAVIDASGNYAAEPLPEGYLADENAAALIADLLLCCELSFSRRYNLWWILKCTRGEVPRDVFATKLHDLIASYTSADEEVAIAGELLRRAAARPKASTLESLQTSFEQLDGKTAVLASKFLSAIVEAQQSDQTDALRRAIVAIAKHLLTSPSRMRLGQRLINDAMDECVSGEGSAPKVTGCAQ